MKESKDFKERKEILKMEKDNLLLGDNLKVKRLEFERENARLFHEQALTRERIKSAEIRKSQMRKQEGFRY